MWNPFKAIACWWRRRKHRGLQVITQDDAGNIVIRPYDGAPIFVATDKGDVRYRGRALDVATNED